MCSWIDGEVTQDDLDAARRSASFCPVQAALDRMGYEAHVGRIDIVIEQDGVLVYYKHDDRSWAVVDAWDNSLDPRDIRTVPLGPFRLLHHCEGSPVPTVVLPQLAGV